MGCRSGLERSFKRKQNVYFMLLNADSEFKTLLFFLFFPWRACSIMLEKVQSRKHATSPVATKSSFTESLQASRAIKHLHSRKTPQKNCRSSQGNTRKHNQRLMLLFTTAVWCAVQRGVSPLSSTPSHVTSEKALGCSGL